ncbi:MAG: ATP-binding protein [Burkholderiales bacterium]
MRSVDWSRTDIGAVQTWSPALRMMVRMLLANRFPQLLWWGPRYVQLYNDAYRPIPGSKHPRSLGQPASECWAEIWHVIGPLIDGPFRGGPATWMEDIQLEINRHGFFEETHFTIAYSSVPDETAAGGIGGVLATVHEITEKVVGERRIMALRDLGDRTTAAKTGDEACAVAARTLAGYAKDVPFALLYLLDRDGRHARLAGASGAASADAVCPPVVDLADAAGDPWSFGAARQASSMIEVDRLHERFPAVPAGPWSDSPRSAVVMPIASTRAHDPVGFLVAGVSARLALDDIYRGFFELVAAQIATAVANARAYEEERERAERLAELDRAKTLFFTNISHEFRTPLTLLLGPAEDALAAARDDDQRERLQLVHRSALRLQKLVNTLLDFSRIEAGRVRAVYEPVDLAALTGELASVFRSAVEKAGMQLRVDCPPLPVPIHVDRGMWEKIVLNLLSNAFKFTLAGAIEVRLRDAGTAVELQVADTGAGIADEHLPHVFDRFHRVEGVPARTHEGTGIGLALVQELVKLHGGTIAVSSTLGKGTTFTVSVPKGGAHLPAERAGAAALASTELSSEHFASEALGWAGVDGAASRKAAAGSPAEGGRPRIVWADDNADVREYVRRILSPRYEVAAVADGEAALAEIRRATPDLVLADVMMPRLDGFGLLSALRTEPTTRDIPVILLSARAGEESRVEGLERGADDYLVKPFSARELLARVDVHVQLARVRREALQRETQLRAEADAANRAKDEFLAMLSHELRNPLAPIQNAVELLRLSGASQRELSIIDRQVKHVVGLVDDLLDIARITRGMVTLETERIEISRTVARAAEMVGPLLEGRRQALAIEVPSSGLEVVADPARLRQVLVNLLTNAAKYSDQGAPIRVVGERRGDSVVLRVIDRGVGIAPEMLDRVFDLFTQQPQARDRAQGGLGIGLAIVRNLVRLHGGTVAARSAGLGKGSEFEVELPLASKGAVATTPKRGDASEPARRDGRAPLRILVVDDNHDSASLLGEILKRFGETVVVASDGPSALDKARSWAPDLALLDIGLPAMDGYELGARLRQQQSAIRLIALTGYGQDADRARSQHAGFEAHLVKPVDVAKLRDAIEGVR